jgi:hypothetical protein
VGSNRTGDAGVCVSLLCVSVVLHVDIGTVTAELPYCCPARRYRHCDC